MTEADRLLNVLPLDSAERRLLLAGRADRPPPGDVDLDWQVLTLALGTAAVTTTIATGAAAATTTTVATGAATTTGVVHATASSAAGATTTGIVHAAASPTAAAAVPVHASAASAASAAGAVTAKAAGVSVGLSVVTKAVTIGFAVGMGLIGAGTAVSEIRQPHEPRSTASSTQPAALPSVLATLSSSTQAAVLPSAPATLSSSTQPPALPSISVTLSKHGANRDTDHATSLAPSRALGEVPALATVLPSSTEKQQQLVTAPIAADASPAPAREVSGALPAPASAVATLSQPLSPVASRTSSLAEQAGDLARVKRLIDGGESTEAIRRLQVSFAEDMHPALSEERDALYVQALTSAHRKAQAVLFAKRFLARYPNSPHAGSMRSLIAAK